MYLGDKKELSNLTDSELSLYRSQMIQVGEGGPQNAIPGSNFGPGAPPGTERGVPFLSFPSSSVGGSGPCVAEFISPSIYSDARSFIQKESLQEEDRTVTAAL